MKIAIVVQGRFHAFHLARALLERGSDVAVLTNYPRWAARRFGLPQSAVRSFWAHGVLSRILEKLRRRPGSALGEEWLHSMFGRWAARELERERWDVVHPFSGVAEESLMRVAGTGTLRLLMRGSAHIREQERLLAEEEQRTRARQDRPTPWRIAREEREYRLADRVVVLSTFAWGTFLQQGVAPEKLRLLPLGANLASFRPGPEVLRARQQRLLGTAPLRVLYVGAMSFRKGLWDLAQAVHMLRGDGFEFRFVGPQPIEARAVLAGLAPFVSLQPKVPEAELPSVYAWGDVYVFPTIEDGYATVVAQAAAAALPVIATTNCSGPDLIREGENGWIVPVRAPGALVARLRWCRTHRNDLAATLHRIHERFQPRDWSEVASDFEAACLEGMELLRR